MSNGCSTDDVVLSVVVPCFNESDGLLHFHRRLCAALKPIPGPIEVIYVNDGSVDDTEDAIRQLQRQDCRVGFVDLSRNFGKEVALMAGIDHARGAAVIVIDADLQDPPELIPDMVRAWRDGYDVVAMKRTDRSSDSRFKRVTASWYYWLLGKLSPVAIPENVGDFRLISRRVVNALKQMPERNRYMKGIFAWVGFNSIELPYHRDARYAGDSKMPLWKLFSLAIDGITSFSIAPLRLASIAGCAVALGAVLFGVVMLIRTALFGDPVAGFPTLIVAITFLGGAQLMAIGVLGEYVGRLLLESKRRPLYLVNHVELPSQSASPIDNTRLPRQALG
ncbi:MAG: glycosyltransferase family 2 protein [Gammaproteobacteria bacterium]|nr:glycosyltransferase family 2 protein [Gammaproteobacteria bacterium]